MYGKQRLRSCHVERCWSRERAVRRYADASVMHQRTRTQLFEGLDPVIKPRAADKGFSFFGCTTHCESVQQTCGEKCLEKDPHW